MEVEEHENVKRKAKTKKVSSKAKKKPVKTKTKCVKVKTKSVKAKKKSVVETMKKSEKAETRSIRVKIENMKHENMEIVIEVEPEYEKQAYRVPVEKMLLKYIRGDGLPQLPMPEGSLDPVKLADELESEIFHHAGNDKEEYYYYARSRSYNISDPTNLKLRNAFLQGSITPAQLAVMTSEEMASDELKAQRLIWWRQGIEESALPSRPENTKSSVLKCIKCGENNVSYNQLQTRSADEPMTTFAECYSCGKRWKFG